MRSVILIIIIPQVVYEINFDKNVQRIKDAPLWLCGHPSYITNVVKFHSES